MDKNRIYNGYYLNDWGVNKIDEAYQLCCHPCDLCDLTKECDRLADDLNKIEYTLCTDIEDKEYKINHPDAYFKKIEIE